MSQFVLLCICGFFCLIFDVNFFVDGCVNFDKMKVKSQDLSKNENVFTNTIDAIGNERNKALIACLEQNRYSKNKAWIKLTKKNHHKRNRKRNKMQKNTNYILSINNKFSFKFCQKKRPTKSNNIISKKKAIKKNGWKKIINFIIKKEMKKKKW